MEVDTLYRDIGSITGCTGYAGAIGITGTSKELWAVASNCRQ